jgi:hypothetical protein
LVSVGVEGSVGAIAGGADGIVGEGVRFSSGGDESVEVGNRKIGFGCCGSGCCSGPCRSGIV